MEKSEFKIDDLVTLKDLTASQVLNVSNFQTFRSWVKSHTDFSVVRVRSLPDENGLIFVCNYDRTENYRLPITAYWIRHIKAVEAAQIRKATRLKDGIL